MWGHCEIGVGLRSQRGDGTAHGDNGDGSTGSIRAALWHLWHHLSYGVVGQEGTGDTSVLCDTGQDEDAGCLSVGTLQLR